MTKQEQIEEMTKTVVDREKNYVIGETECKKCNLNKCDLHCDIHSNISYDCEVLYNADYRKSNEVRKETAKEILQGLESMANNGVYQGKLTVPQMRIFFKEHYGVEVE